VPTIPDDPFFVTGSGIRVMHTLPPERRYRDVDSAARFCNGTVYPMRRRRVQGMGVELKETQQESPV
jgi:hypothetical protein